ncbi:hypothetical protein D0B54_18160 [Solimonas sp. K1W22B-7]|nr:hypothetical protein D0B54_18160 [Solimonas sp. K1W22B-7]
MSGCAWWGYQSQPGSESRWCPQACGDAPDFLAYIYQPEFADSQALKQALAEMLQLIRSAEFAQDVRAFNGWITTPERSADRSLPQVGGEEVYTDVVLSPRRGMHYLVNWEPGQTASTAIDPDRHFGTTILPAQVARWRALLPDGSPDYRQRAQLINTLAHELTHLPTVLIDARQRFKYRDSGWKGELAAKACLVSYRFGQLAECHYLARNAAAPSVAGCMAAAGYQADEQACLALAQP